MVQFYFILDLNDTNKKKCKNIYIENEEGLNRED